MGMGVLGTGVGGTGVGGAGDGGALVVVGGAFGGAGVGAEVDFAEEPEPSFDAELESDDDPWDLEELPELEPDAEEHSAPSGIILKGAVSLLAWACFSWLLTMRCQRTQLVVCTMKAQ